MSSRVPTESRIYTAEPITVETLLFTGLLPTLLTKIGDKCGLVTRFSNFGNHNVVGLQHTVVAVRRRLMLYVKALSTAQHARLKVRSDQHTTTTWREKPLPYEAVAVDGNTPIALEVLERSLREED
jgi:hypothetical protein